MALTFEEQSEKVTDQQFLGRVNQAAIAQAIIVMGEQTDVPGHSERATLAQRVFFGDESLNIARTVVTNPNCGTGADDPLVSDDALLFVVAENWNALSGYSANIP